MNYSRMFAILGPNQFRLSKTLFRISLALGLSAILAIGPQLQLSIAALISSDESNIYDSLHKDTISYFYTYSDWVWLMADPIYLAIALITVFAATRTPSARSIFGRASVALFFLLCTADIAGNFFAAPSDKVNTAENVLSNLAGAPLIAAVLLLICYAADTARKHLSSQLAGRTAAIAIPVLVGVLISSVFFLIGKTFYSATNATIDVTISPPMNGYYGSRPPTEPQDPAPSSREQFGMFLTPKGSNRNLSWVGMARGNTLDWKLPRPGKKGPYKSEIQFFEGCFDYKAIEKSQALTRPYFVDNIYSLGLRLDDGLSAFKVISKGSVRASNDDINMFTIDVKPKQKLELTLFIDPNVQIEHSDWSGDAKYFFSAFLMDGKRPQSRTVQLQINHQTTRLTFHPPTSLLSSDAVGCKPLLIDFSKSRTQSIALRQILVSGVISIHRLNSNDLFADNSDKTVIRGLNGWFSAKDVPVAELATYVQRGNASALLVTGKTDPLFIDGKRYESRSTDRLQATDADLWGDITTDNRLRFTGSSKAMFLNGERANRTRWEKIDWGWQIILLGTIPGLLLFLANVFRNVMQRDHEFVSLHS